jgi:hypothetical protein
LCCYHIPQSAESGTWRAVFPRVSPLSYKCAGWLMVFKKVLNSWRCTSFCIPALPEHTQMIFVYPACQGLAGSREWGCSRERVWGGVWPDGGEDGALVQARAGGNSPPCPLWHVNPRRRFQIPSRALIKKILGIRSQLPVWP